MASLKKIIFFTLFYVPFTLSAQVTTNGAGAASDAGAMSGRIEDASDATAIEFVSVAIINKATGKTAKVTQTDSEGNFKFSNVTFGHYILKASFVGYKSFTKDPVSVSAAHPSLALGTIKLTPAGSRILKEVVVEAKKAPIQLGIDRKIFNVEQSLVSQGGSATDLLANIPSVSVDPDGNVSLRGTSNVRILIDGKPSAMAGGDITQVLQSLPASSIQDIELITNPSSKYDPEGQSGIINIVLKKNLKSGLNGSVAVTGGTQSNYNVGTNLNYRNNKWNLYGNYSFRSGNRLGGGYNNTTYLLQDSSINNASDSKRKRISNTVKVGADFSPSQNTTIGLSGDLSIRNNSSDENLNYQYFSGLIPSNLSYRTSNEDEDDNGYDLNLDFDHKFKRKGEDLSANISYGKDKEDENQQINQDFYTSSHDLLDTLDRRITDTYEKGSNTNIQVDYTLPLDSNSKFEAGYRTTLRYDKQSQLSDQLNLQTGNYERDYNLTNDFNSEDIVHAVYSTYQNQITRDFGFQVGLRAEQAYLNTEYIGRDASGTLPPVKGKLDYFRVYPSVFLTEKLKGDNQLQLSYTRRVNRPRHWAVNPFRDISDPNNIRVGNPNLKPEDIHSFELSYARFWESLTLTSSVYFRRVNDEVEDIRLPQTDSTAATITQFFNVSNTNVTGLELISRINISPVVNLTANFNGYYNSMSGISIGEYQVPGTHGYAWDANLTSDFKFPKNIAAQIRMDYRAPHTVSQGRTREMYGLDAAVSMDVMKDKKGSISLNVRNILNSRKWNGITETEQFIQDFERRWESTTAYLTFSYRFGKQDLKSRKQERNRQPTDDRSEESEMY